MPKSEVVIKLQNIFNLKIAVVENKMSYMEIKNLLLKNQCQL